MNTLPKHKRRQFQDNLHQNAMTSSMRNRRDLLRLAALGSAAPLLAWACSSTPASDKAAAQSISGTSSPAPAVNGIYQQQFGLRPVINAIGPATVFGGTLLSKEVTDAMAEASRSYVNIIELYDAAGKQLAEFTRTEAAMVTSGGFAAMTLAAAACLAGDDADRIAALPQPQWPRCEALIQRAHSTAYEQAYRDAGMKLVHVDTETELLATISDRTAMIGGLLNTYKMTQPGIIPLQRLVDIGQKAGIPVVFDASFAATHNSTYEHLLHFTQMGADLCCISGGKGLHGPQSSGILAGRADLVASARKQYSPTPSALGRGMKVDKEEVVGLMVAVQQFLKRDATAIQRQEQAKLATIRQQLENVPGLRFGQDDSFFGPGIVLQWDQADIPMTYEEFTRQMMAADPPVAMLIPNGPSAYFVTDVQGPAIYAGYLRNGEEVIVAERARQILLGALRTA
jgi:seryl-tRNA(Sec) selenium transferase